MDFYCTLIWFYLSRRHAGLLIVYSRKFGWVLCSGDFFLSLILKKLLKRGNLVHVLNNATRYYGFSTDSCIYRAACYGRVMVMVDDIDLLLKTGSSLRVCQAIVHHEKHHNSTNRMMYRIHKGAFIANNILRNHEIRRRSGTGELKDPTEVLFFLV